MRPDFHLRCRAPCDAPVTDWMLVEDPRAGPVGIWHGTCSRCGRAWTVEHDA